MPESDATAAWAVVAALYRYPVKSMQGETVDRLELTERGARGDRALGVVDDNSGKVLSAKRYPALLQARATTDAAGGVTVTLPTGKEYEAADPAIHAALSEWLDRAVHLRGADEDRGATFDMGVDPVDDASATFEFTGPPGSFADLAAAHLLTTASIAAAEALYPDGQWAVRRFRPTALLEAAGEPGFVEDGWVGHSLRLGAASLTVLMPTVRCALPTRPQPASGPDEPGLPADADISRTLTRHHLGNLGVYCTVTAAGIVAVGDRLGPDTAG